MVDTPLLLELNLDNSISTASTATFKSDPHTQVLSIALGLRLKASPLGFYVAFAVTVTASVQVVGVYLVFASLIVPALAAGRRRWIAPMVGVAGYGLGLLASAVFDLPAGAAIVLALAAAGVVVTLGKPVAN